MPSWPSHGRLVSFVNGDFTNRYLEEQLDALSDKFGRVVNTDSRVMRAILALRLGLNAETVSALLDWRSFEAFCALLLKSAGYDISENLTFVKPRMQLDIIARGPSIIISVDCKLWARPPGASSLTRMARSQLERSRRLRRRIGQTSIPIVSALVTLTDSSFRFVEGVAIVPVHTLRDFALSADSYLDMLDAV